MRTLLSLMLIALVLVIAVLVLGGGWQPAWRDQPRPAAGTVGTTGSGTADRAREIGAEIGQKTAIATERVKEGAHDASITAKIKAKMALDDLVKARAIGVSTDGTAVTLSGSVSSSAEHDRAVALARDTAGVATVLDQLVIR